MTQWRICDKFTANRLLTGVQDLPGKSFAPPLEIGYF
jgi:hypothetical protein